MQISPVFFVWVVLRRDKYDSSSQALFDLHWLPIKSRIEFKILTFVYNCSIGHAPKYLTELLIKQTPNSRLRSATNSENCYVIPFNKRKTFSDRSFGTIGPKLWNPLPIELKQSQNIDTFKKHLKTYYFRKLESTV